MILHSVFLRLRPGVDLLEVDAIMEGLAALKDKLPGLNWLRYGPNLDFEEKSPAFPYGFIAEFEDSEALLTYAEHADHKALGARLVALCEGGADGIMVYDLGMYHDRL